jgi:hypothetical protein
VFWFAGLPPCTCRGRSNGNVNGNSGHSVGWRGGMACFWWVSTLVDTVDPRHAWMLFDELSKYSISMGIHTRIAWIY